MCKMCDNQMFINFALNKKQNRKCENVVGKKTINNGVTIDLK